jgi:dihydrofolate reductase
MIIMIAAASENNALGKTMNWFVYPTISKGSRITSGHHIHYGAKTSSKPLPNRTHVISRQDNYKPEGCSQQHGKVAICPTDQHIVRGNL